MGLLAEGMTAMQDLSIFNPASPPAESIRSLLILVLAVTGAIFVLVECVLIYSIIRFRRQPPSGMEPPQVYGSMPIEIACSGPHQSDVASNERGAGCLSASVPSIVSPNSRVTRGHLGQ